MTVREKILDDRVRLAEARAERRDARALAEITARIAARGVLHSTIIVDDRYERRLESVHDFVAERLRLEREHPLGSESVGSAHRGLLASLERILERHSSRLLEALRQDWKEEMEPFGEGPLLEERLRRHTTEIERIRAQALQEADIIYQEREMGLQLPGSNTVNVQGNVGVVNLGQILGAVNAKVTVLNDIGQADLAKALTALAEAIGSEPSLAPTVRAEAVEVVGDLTTELAGEKRPSRLRAFGARILQLTGDAAKIVTAYENVKAALSRFGIEL